MNTMNRLNFIVAVIAFVVALTSCTNQEAIQVSGQIENAGNVRVVSFFEGERKLDSVFLADGGRFKFERPSSQPRLLRMKVGNREYPLVVTPGETISFRADLHEDLLSYQVENSELSERLKAFVPHQERNQQATDSLQSEFLKLSQKLDAKDIENLQSEYLLKYREIYKDYVNQSVAFAKDNANLAGFYVMSTLDPDVAEQELIEYVRDIDGKFTDNRYVNEFREVVAKLEKLAVGQAAPEFEAFTPSNQLVRLSDYRGKLTLVDFWASWCMPCRKENPNIVNQYNRFKDQGFDVLGVSLDDNPGSWMRAIEEDALDWVQISDLKAWTSDLVIKYQLKAIPSSVLVDENGVIVAKNLRGKELEHFLVAWFDQRESS